MAGLIKKDVLWCGTWKFPDGRELTVNPNDIANAHEQGNAMLRDRLAVKALWEHQPDGIPKPREVWAAKLADPKNRATWAKSVITDTVGFEMGHDHRGPTVVASFDPATMTEEEVRQVMRAGLVSCRLDRNFREGQFGRKYPGLCISHIAVTPSPLETSQGTFEMSAGWPSDETFYMGAGKMAKETPPSETVEKPAATSDNGDGEFNADNPVGNGGGENTSLRKLLAALQTAYGFVPPTGAKSLDDLTLAIEAVGLNGGANAANPGGTNAPPDVTAAGGGGGGVGGGGMLMSQLDYAKKWPSRVKNDRAEIVSKIKALVTTGRIPRDVGKKLFDEFKTFEMSYNPTTAEIVETGLLAAVNAAETYFPENTFIREGDGINMSGVAVAEERPAKLTTPPTGTASKEVEAVGDDLVAKITAQNPAGAKL